MAQRSLCANRPLRPAKPSGTQKARRSEAGRKSRLAPFGPAKASGMHNPQMTGEQLCRTSRQESGRVPVRPPKASGAVRPASPKKTETTGLPTRSPTGSGQAGQVPTRHYKGGDARLSPLRARGVPTNRGKAWRYEVKGARLRKRPRQAHRQKRPRRGKVRGEPKED
jgi:hypothetical protein